MSTASHTEVRQQLARNGYSPLPLEGKAPSMMKGWQHKQNTGAEDIELWAKLYPAAKNTGVLTKFTPTLDVDIFHEEAATAVEELAKERFESADIS